MAETTQGMNLIDELVNPDGVETADLAVFIPSHQEAGNIALPTRKAAAGLEKFYPQLRAVIVNCDNCSQDGTREAFFAAESQTPRIYVSSPPGLRGKGANLVNMFQVAAQLKARVVLMIDANLLSVKTTWIKSLIDPILNGSAQYVSPLYLRHRYDSPISRSLAYPLLRALFGRRVLQPINVDHAFCGRLNEIYRGLDWSLDDRGYKSDMRLLTTAIMNQAPICQSFMAHPRVSASGSLDSDLPRAFAHMAGALFDLMIETWDFWSRVRRSRPTILHGIDETPVNPAPIVEVDRRALKEGFVDRGREVKEVWREFFSPELFAGLTRELDQAGAGQEPAISVDLWRQAVFAAATAYKKSGPPARRDLLDSLFPLFLGKGLTVHSRAEGLDERQYNSLMEAEAVTFEEGKAELIRQWAGAENGNEREPE